MSEHYGQEDVSGSSDLAGSDSGNLYGAIDRDRVHGLNLTVPEDARAVIKAWSEREDTTHFADSGVDDQLVIHIPFVQNVRIRSILLKLGRGEVTPRHLRIYTNHPNIIDFADAESTEPQLDVSLLEGQIAVTEYPLRTAAFANINSLSLHFGDAVGEQVSRIYFIGFKGDIRTPQKDSRFKLDIPAANAADAPLVDKVADKAKGRQSTAR